MRIKIIRGGHIINIVQAETLALVTPGLRVGETALAALDGDAIYAPVETPESVPAGQLKQWLIGHGKDDAVEAILKGIADATEAKLARNYWDSYTVFRRDHAMVASIGAALGMSGAEIDAAFREAALLG